MVCEPSKANLYPQKNLEFGNGPVPRPGAICLCDGRARLAAAQDEADFTPGAVFGMSNDVDGNEVVAFNRGADGRHEPAGTFETGGTIEDSANGLIKTK